MREKIQKLLSDPKKFLEWLEMQPASQVVGEAVEADRSPVVNFLGYSFDGWNFVIVPFETIPGTLFFRSAYGGHEMKMGLTGWVNRFECAVDREENSKITAAQALVILEKLLLTPNHR
jgi:hypothetical protein